jgi:hypothetical protein
MPRSGKIRAPQATQIPAKRGEFFRERIVMASVQPSELTVVTKAKDLCSYVMTVTQKSPKQFRFTFVSRLQNLSLDIIEYIYRANDTFIGIGCPDGNKAIRLDFQHKAMTSLKLLAYIAELSMSGGCILMKQYEQVAQKSSECIRFLSAWMNSDRKRLRD